MTKKKTTEEIVHTTKEGDKVKTKHFSDDQEMEEFKEPEENKGFEQEFELSNEIQKKDLPQFETVVDSIPFHNFDKHPIFTGLFIEKFKVADIIDNDTGQPKPFMALKFVDYDTGEYVALRVNHSIVKAIEKAEDKDDLKDGYEYLYNIEFLGKTMVKGKRFNQYKIGIASVKVDLS